MTTDSNNALDAAFVAGDGNTWAEAVERPETWKPVAPLGGCTFSGYEVSDKGRTRSVDRKQGNRQLRGQVLAAKPHEDGYVLTTIRCDSTDQAHERRHTVTVHKVMLTTFDGPCPPGMEACHSDRGPAFNWWPEGVRWDTKPRNHADQVAAGTAVVPESFPCRNHARCGGAAKSEGRRCPGCFAEARQQAAALLVRGMPLPEVAARLGNSERWIHQIAAEGGYGGSIADARAQRPGVRQRVALRLYLRRVHDV